MSAFSSTLNLASQHLAALDPRWAVLIERVGPCGLAPNLEREPYQALVHAVAHQQLHGRAAEAILKRFVALFPEEVFPSPQQILSLEVESLRACGFSLNKITCLRGIAEQALSGLVPSRAEAMLLSDDELINRLISLRGVGRWTVEMLLIFTLGRLDILPVDDFGVREGYRVLYGLEVQPTPKQLRAGGEAWNPYRSVAAWYLWRAADLAKAA